MVALVAVVVLAGALRVDNVVNGVAVDNVDSDADVYTRIAAAVYSDHRFGPPDLTARFDWSPGAPLFYGGIYVVTGGARPGVARLSIALLGLVTVVLAYLLGRRLSLALTGDDEVVPRWGAGGAVAAGAGLLAALSAAIYPTFIYNTGRLLSEPLAQVTVPAAVLAFFWAADGRSQWRWLAPGALIGASALIRPEYLVFGFAFIALGALLIGWRVWRGPGGELRAALRPTVLAALAGAIGFVVVLAPWSAYVSHSTGRFVPVSTGGGKALFIGSYLDGGGIYLGVKHDLLRRYEHRDLTGTDLRDADIVPVLDKIARRYPDMPRDAALGRIGKQQLKDAISDRPLDFASMVVSKARNMWRGSSRAMRSAPKQLWHFAMIVLAAVGLVALALRRRFEAWPLALLLLGITVLAGLVLAAPRRNLALMPLVMALSSATVSWLVVLAAPAVRARIPGSPPARAGSSEAAAG